jgi:hypothetical protein
MALRTNDERTAVADTAIETAIASMLTGDNGLNRKQALRFLVRRAMKKNVGNQTRLRVASENPGAI